MAPKQQLRSGWINEGKGLVDSFVLARCFDIFINKDGKDLWSSAVVDAVHVPALSFLYLSGPGRLHVTSFTQRTASPCSTFDVSFMKRQPSQHGRLRRGCLLSKHACAYFCVHDGMLSLSLLLTHPSGSIAVRKKRISWMLNKHVCWIIEDLGPERALICTQALWTSSPQRHEDQWLPHWKIKARITETVQQC